MRMYLQVHRRLSNEAHNDTMKVSFPSENGHPGLGMITTTVLLVVFPQRHHVSSSRCKTFGYKPATFPRQDVGPERDG
jgi:hypothetical protein